MDADAESSPFFPVAATLMVVINLVLGLLGGLFNSSPESTGLAKAGFVSGYTVGTAIAVPLLIVFVLRLFGVGRGRRGFLKAFFFVSVAMFAPLVIGLTAGVVERMDIIRQQKAEGSVSMAPTDHRTDAALT